MFKVFRGMGGEEGRRRTVNPEFYIQKKYPSEMKVKWHPAY
jgi:hypothetical protein